MVAAPEKGGKSANVNAKVSASSNAGENQQKQHQQQRQQSMQMELTPRATDMLSWLRAHKSILETETGFNAVQTLLFKKNDTARYMVPALELDTNAAALPGVDAARAMLEHKDEILEKSKQDLISAYPFLAEDSPVSKAIWHDIGMILRVVSYAAAAKVTTFLHKNNIGILRELYAEMSLPDALVKTMINSLKEAVLGHLSDSELQQSTGACFDAVSEKLCD